jgi:hypothetical protein
VVKVAATVHDLRRRHGSAADLEEFSRRFVWQDGRWRLSAPIDQTQADSGALLAGPTRPADESAAPAAGDLPNPFGRYQILRKLGQGGMGTVYLAHDSELERQVALKVPQFVDRDPEARERFFREARAAATLSHPHICPVFDVGRVGDVHYMTMAFIEGRTLCEHTRKDNLLPPRDAVALVRQLALALDEAHARGVVHRDLKPANVMLNARGEPVIMDFGLARRSAAGDARLTRSGTIMGTPAYMAPEQVEGNVEAQGPATDVHALGVILFELLTGELPFQGSAGSIMSQILTQRPPSLTKRRADLAPALDAVCQQALAKKPEHRFASMKAFADALGACLEGRPPRRRQRGLFAAAGLLALALAVAAAVTLLRKKDVVPIPETPAAGELRVLCIGVNKFEQRADLGELKLAEADARDLAALFEGAVLLSAGQQGHPHLTPRRVNVRRELRALAGSCGEADVLLVAFAGREVVLPGDEAYYLGLSDSNPDDRATLFPLAEVYDEMAKSKARLKWLLVDACRPRLNGERTPPKVTPPPGVTVFFSCSDGQFAFEDAEHNHGVFSYYVLEGLRGSADVNRDGWITLAELRQFISDGVADRFKGKQTPEFFGPQPEKFALPAGTGPKGKSLSVPDFLKR